MKIRIEKQLLRRVQACAMEVELPVSRWATLALRQYRAGELGCVASGGKAKNATRSGSVVCTMPGEPEEAEAMRAALRLAVEYCEARRPKPFLTSLVEGKDYVVVDRKDIS